MPEKLAGKDAIELGCGTAYISAWLSRRGACVVGVDNSEAQLRTARRLQRQYGLDFSLINGDAEAIAYPNGSFDFAISEYGACLWADPQRWVPEAARLLRPGGQLVFLIDFAGMHLPEYKVPCQIIFTEELPHGPTGKIDRKILRENAGRAVKDNLIPIKSISAGVANNSSPDSRQESNQ